MEFRDEWTPAHVELVLLVLDEINKRIREADVQLAQAAESDPICKLLQTVPGVGVLTTMYFVWAVDNIERFANAHALQSYLGITPGENSTGLRRQVTSITKAGPPDVRRMLTQACWVMLMHRPDDPLVKWAKLVAARRGKKVAVVAMSRKLAGILYAMWRDGTPYCPKKSAQAKEDGQKTSLKKPKKADRR
jgi:transposase